jgi:tetratricopeptide (TPR) repeat protein
MRGWLAAVIGCACATAALAASPGASEAQALMNQGQFAQALERLDRYLVSSPQDAEARFTRGLVLVRLNRNDDAAKAFSDLTRDFPQLPEPYNNLAVIYAQQGEYEKARRALEDALAMHPSYAVAHENLGDIYAALSTAAYNRALTLDPKNASVRAKLNLVNQLDRLADSSAKATTVGAAPEPAAGGTQPQTPAASPDRNAVAEAVQAWAAAWSAQDVDQYLSFYAPEFTPEGGVAREAWEAQRRERIARPKQIQVVVTDLKVTPLGAGAARATFRQDYRSDSIANQSVKTLELAQSGGRWQIRRETSR